LIIKARNLKAMKKMNLSERSIFIIFILSAAALFSGCSEENGAGIPPVIYSISPDTVGAGDTIIVEGDRFNITPWKNRIAFSPGEFTQSAIRRYAVPFEGDQNILKAVVPVDLFAGKLRAEQISPIAGLIPLSGGEIFLPTSSLLFHLTLDQGDVSKGFFCSEGFDFPLCTGGTKRHLLVVFSNSVPPDGSANYNYSIELDGVTGSAFIADGEKMKPINKKTNLYLSNDNSETGSFGFDRKKREETIGLLKREGANLSYEIEKEKIYSYLTEGRAAPDSMGFDVFSDYNGSTTDPGSYTRIKAYLKYEGSHTLLYLDSSTDPGCITDLEAYALGQEFEQSVYQTDREYYGEESDINGDEKVVILMSPVVNELTPDGVDWYIAGFFLPTDLLPSMVDANCTNAMEIFYTIVPDPGGIYGPVLPKEGALESIEGVLGHEFIHMIMFNYRVLIYGSGFLATYIEEVWLEEGLAHMAEYLNGHFADNIGRADKFLDDPGDVSLVYGEDNIPKRGAAFLFLRYLGDRYGDGIFKELVQSKRSGIENIENVTGEDFIELFADWSAALYLSGKGIANDPRFEYSSIDLDGDFKPLDVTSIISLFSSLSGNVRALAPEFIEFNLSSEATHNILIQSSSHGSMNAIIIRRQ
jgi:hypothetical protein